MFYFFKRFKLYHFILKILLFFIKYFNKIYAFFILYQNYLKT